MLSTRPMRALAALLSGLVLVASLLLVGSPAQAAGAYTPSGTPLFLYNGETLTPGEVLSANGTSWSPDDGTSTFQWVRDATSASNGTVVGSTNTYEVQESDRTHTITLRETRTGPSGTPGTAQGDPVQVPVAGTFKNVVRPSIEGTGAVGSRLDAEHGTWNQDPESYEYQWLDDGADIDGADTGSYEIPAGAIGSRYSVRVTALRTGFPDSEAVSDVVVAKATFSTVTAALTGTVRVGSTLNTTSTASPGPDRYDRQWLRDGQPIAGATSYKYVLASSDAGRSISVRVTAVKVDHLSRSEVSPAVKVPAYNTRRPAFTGTTKVGSTLYGNRGTWSAPDYTLSYQWLRNGAAVSGATSYSRKLTSADRGRVMSLRVTAKRAGWATVTATSVGSAKIR